MEVNVNTLDESLTLSENAIKVLEKRYLKRDKDGNCVEKPADMFRRVADAIAAGDLKYGIVVYFDGNQHVFCCESPFVSPDVRLFHRFPEIVVGSPESAI